MLTRREVPLRVPQAGSHCAYHVLPDSYRQEMDLPQVRSLDMKYQKSWRRRQAEHEQEATKPCRYCTQGYISGVTCPACHGTGKARIMLWKPRGWPRK